MMLFVCISLVRALGGFLKIDNKALFKEMQQARSKQSLDHCLHLFLKQFLLNAFTFTLYGQDVRDSFELRHQVSTGKVKAWHQYFIENEFDKLDVIGDKVKTQMHPIYWDNFDRIKTGPEKARPIYQASIEFGFERGISIPVHGPYQSLSIAVLHDNNIMQKIPPQSEAIYDIHLFLIYYHSALIEKTMQGKRTPALNTPLTKRELQVLNCISKEMVLEEIAQSLKIKTRTVNFHIENIHL